jgi:hypothetical protein
MQEDRDIRLFDGRSRSLRKTSSDSLSKRFYLRDLQQKNQTPGN